LQLLLGGGRCGRVGSIAAGSVGTRRWPRVWPITSGPYERVRASLRCTNPRSQPREAEL
jgi:hypothetical protein